MYIALGRENDLEAAFGTIRNIIDEPRIKRQAPLVPRTHVVTENVAVEHVAEEKMTLKEGSVEGLGDVEVAKENWCKKEGQDVAGKMVAGKEVAGEEVAWEEITEVDVKAELSDASFPAIPTWLRMTR